MKINNIIIDWQNRRFIRDIFYGSEDGLPEGYTLYLEETVHPTDNVFYRNGSWGESYDLSPQTLTLIYNCQEERRSYKEIVELDKIENGCLYWLDIYDDIILYASPYQKYESIVLCNIKTKKKIIATTEQHELLFKPRLLVQGQKVYVGFENTYENIQFLCFDKNTLEQITPHEIDVNQHIQKIKSEIEKRRDKINLLPDHYYNRYNVDDLSTIIQKVSCKQYKYKDCPMSLIKQMYKIRLAYAKENNIKLIRK